MQWDDEARQKLAEVPALLRGFVTKKVEETARRLGAERVTLGVWDEAKRLREGGGGSTHDGHGPSGAAATGDDGLPPAEVLAALVQQAEAKGLREGKTFRLKVCGGAFGCPRPQIDVAALAAELEAELARSGHGERLAAALGDRILTHHKLALSVSGCVNGCSEPQTKDFGVLGQARPEAVPGRCTGCGKCERTCKEGAVRAGGPKAPHPEPAFDRSACLNCGDCAKACPSGAITATPGYRVIVGGRLGRHPRLAETLVSFTDRPEQVVAALRAVLEWAAEVGTPGERLGALVDRFGLQAVQSRIEAAADRSRNGSPS